MAAATTVTSPISETALRTLIAKDEIYDALVRYCRGVDRKDAELVRSAYHEDATDNHGFMPVKTGWELAASADRNNSNDEMPKEWLSTTRRLTNVLIRVDGDRASSESYYVATQRFAHGEDRYNLVATGRYVDQWERRDGGTFKISDRVVITDAIETLPVPGMWPGPDSEVPKAFWGAPAFEVPPNVPFGSETEDDVSYGAIPKLQ